MLIGQIIQFRFADKSLLAASKGFKADSVVVHNLLFKAKAHHLLIAFAIDRVAIDIEREEGTQ